MSETKDIVDMHNLSFELGKRLNELPVKTALGLLRGFDKAVAVVEAHAKSHGEVWMNQDDVHHVMHAYDHVVHTDIDGDELFRKSDSPDDDGLHHLDHAATRLLFAIAKREGM